MGTKESGSSAGGSKTTRPGKTHKEQASVASGRQRSGASQQMGPDVGAEHRHQMIAEAAYFLAEKRGFECGCELDDWLAAEGDVCAGLVNDAQSAGGESSPPKSSSRSSLDTD